MKDVSSILQKKLNGLLGQPNKYEKTSLLSRLNSSINPFSVLIYKGFPNHFFLKLISLGFAMSLMFLKDFRAKQ